MKLFTDIFKIFSMLFWFIVYIYLNILSSQFKTIHKLNVNNSSKQLIYHLGIVLLSFFTLFQSYCNNFLILLLTKLFIGRLCFCIFNFFVTIFIVQIIFLIIFIKNDLSLNISHICQDSITVFSKVCTENILLCTEILKITKHIF